MRPPTTEQLLAAAGLLACAAWFIHMSLGKAPRQRLLGWWHRLRLRFGARRVARTEAARAIERARRGAEVERRGNVYKPKAWGDDSKPPTLH